VGRRQQRRAGVPADERLVAELDPQFAALRYFALNGTDHRSHAEQGDAIAGYIRWRNARAQPKRDFASGSVIRTWTSYQKRLLDAALAFPRCALMWRCWMSGCPEGAG
jgi:hypothetical protein